MTYAIVANWDGKNNPTRTNTATTEDEATLIVGKLIKNFPNAFYDNCPTYTETVDGVNQTFNLSEKYWVIDSNKKTITGANSKKTSDEAKELALNTLITLEKSVTPRRIREMTTDAGKKWVEDIEKLIATERAKL